MIGILFLLLGIPLVNMAQQIVQEYKIRNLISDVVILI